MKLKIIFLSLLFSFNLRAAYFIQLNNFIDTDCPEWNLERFQSVNKWITIGVEGAKNYGFDYEVPISREGVDALWCALVPARGQQNNACKSSIVDLRGKRPFSMYANRPALNSKSSKQSFRNLEDQYNYFLKYLKEVTYNEDIFSPNVGAVLEILSRDYLQKTISLYPLSRYKIGSGLAYHYNVSSNTIGELDIIVYDRYTCDVITIGESKASSRGNQSRSLKKAKGQLLRFQNFLKRSRLKN